MNFESLRWPKPIEDTDPENVAELLDRQRADEISARQEEEEIERTADLVAEQEKKARPVPKKIYHSHPEKKYRSGAKKAEERIQAPAKKDETSEPDIEGQEGDEVRHPYDEIYPYHRTMRR